MLIIIMAIAIVSPVGGLFCTLVNYNKYRNAVSSGIGVGLSFACAWYGYIVDSGNDIFRHIMSMHDYANKNIFEIWGLYRFNRNVFTFDFWLWIISKLNNDRMLQASGALVGYSILAYIVFDYARLNNEDFKSWFTKFLLSLALVPGLDIAIGIRCANAFILMGLAIYEFCYKKSHLSGIVCVILAFFLHQASLLVFIAWVLSTVFEKHKVIVSILTIVLLFTFTNYGNYSAILSDSSSILGQIFSDLFKSAGDYQSLMVTSFHSLFTRYLEMLFAFSLISRTVIVKRKNPDSVSAHLKEEKVLMIAELLFIMSMCTTFLMGSNGNRYFIATCIVAFIPFMASLNTAIFLNKRFLLIDLLALFSACGSVALYLYNMNWGSGSLISWILCFVTGIVSSFGLPIHY